MSASGNTRSTCGRIAPAVTRRPSSANNGAVGLPLKPRIQRRGRIAWTAIVFLANSGLRAGAPGASRRLVAYLLQAFRAGTGTVGGLPRPVPIPLDTALR
jgi:hypothetical protein